MNHATQKFGALYAPRWSQITPRTDFVAPIAAPKPQPSLRVPATPGNRLRLRILRAAEEAAWEKGVGLFRNREELE